MDVDLNKYQLHTFGLIIVQNMTCSTAWRERYEVKQTVQKLDVKRVMQ